MLFYLFTINKVTKIIKLLTTYTQSITKYFHSLMDICKKLRPATFNSKKNAAWNNCKYDLIEKVTEKDRLCRHDGAFRKQE